MEMPFISRSKLNKEIADQVREQLSARLWLYEKQANKRVEKLLGNAIAVVHDALTVAPDCSYDLLVTETESSEYVEGVLDLDALGRGDQVGLEIWLKFPDGRESRWKNAVYSGESEDSAWVLPTLLCPAGVRITAKHIAGKPFSLHYFFVRRR